VNTVPGSMAMANSRDLADAKRKLSRRLLDEAGVSGVGLRKDRLVVYLAADDPAVRGKAEEAARQLGVTAPLLFEVTGELRKR
jgi:hypothetical protein